MTWTDVALGYGAYLLAVAWLGPRFARARGAATLTAALALGLWWIWPRHAELSAAWLAVLWVVVPSLAILVAYRASGAFFVEPSTRLERALLAADHVLLRRSHLLRLYNTSRGVREVFELFYLLVYAVLPLGAVALLVQRHEAALPRYWLTVFVAELTCYAALPWLQSRPPRVIEPVPAGVVRGPVGRLNLLLLRHGSIQVNTVPSAHAAGAVAVALAVLASAPSAGVAFLVVAIGITLATVLGRYHYALDSILGVVVAAAAWGISRP